MIPKVMIKNAEEMLQGWEHLCNDPRLNLIEVQHAEADNSPRGGLSDRGEEQATQTRLTVGSALKRLTQRRGYCRFFSSNTRSCIRTTWHLVASLPDIMDPETFISTPKDLDLGEPPVKSYASIRAGIEKVMNAERTAGGVIIYCGDSPPTNTALGIPGTMAELEALFLAYNNGEFRLLGRVAPEFSG